METNTTKKVTKMEVIEPVGLRILICKDEDKKSTKGGIILPDNVEIPVLTGRVVAISAQVEHDPDFPIKPFDKVIVDPSNSMPVSLERDNQLHLIPIQDVVAIVRSQ